VISWVFFVPLNIFWAFPEIVFALKNISEKNTNFIPSVWAEPEGRTRTRSGSAARPAKAHRPGRAMAMAAATFLACVPR
jgi:hypothetical protein